AMIPQVFVNSPSGYLLFQNEHFDFHINCIANSPFDTIIINDNDNDIATINAPNGITSFDYYANGGIGLHTVVFTCVDDSAENGFVVEHINEIPSGVHADGTPITQTFQQSQNQQNVQQIDAYQSQYSFHFDNGLFLACLIVASVITIFLIIALASGGWFRKPPRLEPSRPANIFDLYRDSAIGSVRPFGNRGSLPLGYDETDVSIELPPPTKILDSVWNDPEAKRENVRRLASDPVAMMEAKRIEMTNNLGRICPKCTDPIRNERGEIIHCVYCCKFFKDIEQLDVHVSQKHPVEAGI
ncbi:MAG: hypothetical protein WA799_00895, partial [Nitrosotalea sp.]